MRILVNPDQLRALSAQLQQVAGDLQGVESRVSGALSGLDWEARQKVGVEGQVGNARNQARALAAQAEEISRYLASKAQAFEEADGQGAASLPRVPRPSFPLPVPLPPRLPWPFPTIPIIFLPFIPLLPIILWPPRIIIRPPRISLPPWFPVPKPGPRPTPTPIPTPTPTPPPPRPEPTPQPEPGRKPWPKPVEGLNDAKPEDYSAKDGCVKYAKARRPDLEAAGGGAAKYINKHKDKIVQVTDKDTDLREKIAKGYAIVWPVGHSWLKGTAGETNGHVAIIEEVGPDYVIVSQAGVGSNKGPTTYPRASMRMKIPKSDLVDLVIIGA